MRKILFYSLSLYITLQFFQRCANPASPTGGPRDTIPPSLILANPAHESLRFKEKNLELTFDEFINADRLKSSLVITPTTDIGYSYIIRKNRIVIRLEEFLEDSTTYTFNFLNGITDITEKNPSENLVLAFSTGTFIDSLTIEGTVKDLLSQLPQKGVLIGLYLNTDSLDYQTEKPRYFNSSLEDGSFRLNNIKNDEYRLFAFLDANGNALFDPAGEAHGFLARDIYLDSNLDSIEIFTQLIDISDFKQISSRPFGRTFDVRYNKEVKRYSVIPLKESDSFPASILSADKTTIKFYNNIGLSYTDSLGLIIQSYDTVKYELIDTVFVEFLESSRKPEIFNIVPSYEVLPSGLVTGNLSFSKPVSTINRDFYRFKADTMFSNLFLNDSNYLWNPNRTNFSFNYSFDWKKFNDSLNSYFKKLVLDTLSTSDTSYQFQPRSYNSVNIEAAPGTFISVEGDSSLIITNKITRIKTDDLGLIQLAITTDYPSFRVDITNNKKVVIRSYRNEKNKTLKNIPPGGYTIKVFIDSNQDGQWSPAFLGKDIPAEPIYIYPSIVELRANWEVLIEDISF